MVEKPKRVSLREVWKKGEPEFTKWLRDNMDVLSEQIGFNLNSIESEKSVGAFSADNFAEDESGDTVIIENQFEKTDHDHLGKLITYLSNLEAKKAIWITSEPRQEHVTAIKWLNEFSPEDISFYLVKLEAYKLGDSEPGPFLTPISGPSVEVKKIGEQKKELSERHLRRLEFWEKLLEKAEAKTKLHSNVSPSKDNWVTAGAGKSGMGWAYAITMNKGSVELFIDFGPDKKKETDEVYEKILQNKDKIEKEFGEPLMWDKIEGRRVCRIKSFTDIGGLKDTGKWDSIQEDMIDRMIRLEQSLRPALKKIR